MKIEIGDKAPVFELKDQEGKLRKLSDYLGNPLILYFYPKDDTPGCTKEACNFRDDYSQYEQAGVQIIGVSPDSPESHRRFQKKYDLPFPLLADEDHKVAEKYGTWALKKSFGREYFGILRTTFLITVDGFVQEIYEKVKPADHSAQILEAISELPSSS